MSIKPVHEMRPKEIMAARESSGCAFIPVSPAFEWHSFHLPIGTDAIISETIARLAAERVNGVYFPVLSFGLDEYRPKEQLLQWGFKPADKVYGMNFPSLPLTSEYAEKEEMLKSLLNRVRAVRESGFRNIFIVNNHGGKGQVPELRNFAEKHTTEKCTIFYIATYRFITLEHGGILNIGGHAGLSETMMVLAFRPDLVDLSQLPDGELDVQEYGILHDKPTIESKWNPRNSLIAIANELRENIIDNFVDFITTQVA